MVRIVASLSFRLRDTTSCTASTADGPASQTACITSFSKSVKGARKRASLSVRLDMVQYVPLHHVIVKESERPGGAMAARPAYRLTSEVGTLSNQSQSRRKARGRGA